MEKLGEILEKSLKRLDPAGRLTEYGVWPIWNDTVGPTIARNAQPEKIRHGTLFVKVTGPTWIQQLQYMKEMIAEKLNQSLGREVVKNIFFVVGKVEYDELPPRNDDSPPPSRPKPESKLGEEQLHSIRYPEIRKSLQRLFEAQSQRGRS
ncbi:MAG: DciA family protein [Candidatus Binatia bacterium]